MKSEDRYNPTIDAGARRDVGIVEHAFDISSVDFYD
jgi:hypothetical protein